MSETGIMGITLDNIPLNAINTAFMRKLNGFDCVIAMDEQGNDKLEKAQLAVLDAVTGKKTPSVLIITTGKLMYEWYRSMIGGIGVDFKFITPDPKSINYFSPKLSSLYIANKESGSNPIFGKIKESGLVWDLVIIDGGLSRAGIETETILDSFDLKAKKLVVFASYLVHEQDAAEKLSKLPEKFLADSGKAEYFKKHYPDKSVIDFTLSTPFTKYYGKDPLSQPDIKVIRYAVNEQVLKAKAEQSGAPAYTYGGNIFEELTLDMRKLYNADRYDDEIVTGLRQFDTKLNAYLDELSRLTEDPDSRIITYFSSEKTLEYVYKVLSSSVIGLKRVTAIKKSSFFGIDDTISYFEAETSRDIRIVLSTDVQDEKNSKIPYITHVINYELPTSPLVLHRRYKQGGINGSENPQFILFRDETDQFDGRMLKNVLALNFCSSFSHEIPGRNIYLFIDDLNVILADLIYSLEGAEDFDENAVQEAISKYNLKTAGDNAKLTLSVARDETKLAFEVPAGKVTKDFLASHIGEKLEALRKGCCFFDFNGSLQSKEYAIRNNEEYSKLEGELENDPFVRSRNAAREIIDQCRTPDKLYGALIGVDEYDKSSVCYCTWRYIVENCEYKGDYNQFLKDIFEEAI